MELIPDPLPIEPLPPVSATLKVPGSKSITNRALVCAAMAHGQSRLTGALDSEDTRVMIRALTQLGIDCKGSSDRSQWVVDGCGGRWRQRDADLEVSNSGTTMRFLTALLAAGKGHYHIDGIQRMRRRPIADLLSALSTLGASVRSKNNDGCPPVVLDAGGLEGGEATIHGDISSQFLSGLLMAAPYARRPVQLLVDGPLVSKPYVQMTLAVMQSFGVSVTQHEMQRFEIPAPRVYQATAYAIEPDASAASYFWAAAAIVGGTVTVEGIGPGALQGDVAFCDLLEKMGCRVDRRPSGITVHGPARSGIDVDMNAISDTVQTLAAVALFVKGPTAIRGVAHIRHKETDRISDLARELRKLGAHVVEWDDGLQITPGALHAATIETYNDHRMAMSLSLVGLRVPGVQICNPSCTEKTYPQFFLDLRRLAPV